jgi:hypothetical protein
MILHQAAETMALHRTRWAGRMVSAFVVMADGTIQLFAPAQIASMLQETGFAMDVTRVVGPIVLACAILYAIPATAVLGARTGAAEEMYEAVNAGWMDLGAEGTEHVAGTTSARDVFEAAQNAIKA